MQSRRDRNSELIVALAVMGTLALGLAFGIILTLSSQVEETATPSTTAAPTTAVAAAPSATQTPASSDTPRASHTPAPSATHTPRATATATHTPRPTQTATRTPRAMITVGVTVADRATTQTATRTPRPTATATRTATPTQTATHTHTPAPSATPSATRTPRPTATRTPSATHTPRPTATRTFTATPSPTATPSATHTPRPTATATAAQRHTSTPRPTLTFTPYPTLTPSITPFGGEQTRTPSASGCPIPEAWIAYSVQPGDTLFSLARRWGVGTSALAEANCLDDPNAITVGQILYAPPGSDVTPRPTAATAGTGRYTRFNCDNPSATISDPRPGAVLRGTVGIYGTATHPNFQFYRLQISGSEQPENFATLGVYRQAVKGGQLGTLNTAAFAPGDYWLRLTVVDNTANYPPECTVRVRIER